MMAGMPEKLIRRLHQLRVGSSDGFLSCERAPDLYVTIFIDQTAGRRVGVKFPVSSSNWFAFRFRGRNYNCVVDRAPLSLFPAVPPEDAIADDIYGAFMPIDTHQICYELDGYVSPVFIEELEARG